MQQLIIYPLLCTRSRRAVSRAKWRYGRPYNYKPRMTLIDRLCSELGWSRQEVLTQLWKEREYLLGK